MSLRIARPSSETLVHHGPIPGPTSANQLVAGSGGMGTPPPSLTVEPPPLSPRRKSASCIASSKMNRSFSLKSNPDTTGGENIRVDSSASSNYHQSVTTNSDSDSEGITSESDSVNTSTISQMGCDLGNETNEEKKLSQTQSKFINFSFTLNLNISIVNQSHNKKAFCFPSFPIQLLSILMNLHELEKR